jgi:DNA-binding beta-propeller fold protein YncE
MRREVPKRAPRSAAGLTLALLIAGALAHAQPNVQYLPNMGQQITPLAPQDARFQPLNPGIAAVPDNPAWLAGHAVTSVVSPDQTTLLVLTSGFNRYYTAQNATPPWNASDSNEYVFIYDISARTPVKKQVVTVPNTYHGIAFDPLGKAFYVAGAADDSLHIFALNAKGVWAEATGSPVALNHISPIFGVRLGVGLNIVPNDSLAINSSLGVGPCAAGVAISKNGQMIVVANYYNDSISVLTGGLGKWSLAVSNFDLRPGKIAPTDPTQVGKPGGEYPFWAAVSGDGTTAKPYTAYVSSIRDREIDVVDLSGAPVLTTRIHVKGQPNKMTMNAAHTLLFVAEDQSDTVDIINIDPAPLNLNKNTIIETIPVIASMLPTVLSQNNYKGANPNSVTLSPDESQLYVTNGNLNCIAVISLSGVNSGNLNVDKVVGLIPTGWYPNSVSLVSFPAPNPAVYAYVVNGKSPTGANPGWCYGGYGPPNSPNCFSTDSYNPQLIKAGFQSFPLPSLTQLAKLTAQVATNNRFSYIESSSDAAVMATVRQSVKHVIFIVKENRTYDQILGDLEVGNGDPDLAMFGASVTPNQHQMARQFVTLDNFMDTAEVSYDGWLWTTAAQAPDVVQHQYPVTYAYRALSLDSEGTNRQVNVAIPDLAGRIKANPFTANDPDVMAGQADVSAPDGPDSVVDKGYLWSAAMRAGLTVRNYGFFIDLALYSTNAHAIPVLRYPASTGTTVAIPTNAELAKFTDPYFRGFDNSLPDYYRYVEWAREFDQLPARRQGDTILRQPTALPALSLVRFMHDHTGNWTFPGPPIDGVNTPELMVADNDYAVGLLIQKVAKSAYANSTLIFVIEDDAQDGGDHVDSHRSTAFVVGPFVKQGAVVSTPYNTLNFLRTIEEVLGIPPMNLNDALARPMVDIFDTTNPAPLPWTFTATPAPRLFSTGLPLYPRLAGLNVPKSTHNAKYWARVTKGMDFTNEDRVDAGDFNRILWKGLMGNKPYPATPSGLDLRQNREQLLARYRQSLMLKPAQEPNTGTN